MILIPDVFALSFAYAVLGSPMTKDDVCEGGFYFVECLVLEF